MISLFFGLMSLAAIVAWNLPDALRWLIIELAARVAYIEAGRQAAHQERFRLEVSGQNKAIMAVDQ